jgi:hypothetical protein
MAQNTLAITATVALVPRLTMITGLLYHCVVSDTAAVVVVTVVVVTVVVDVVE